MKKCFDPEIPVNIVDLGLIYDLQISEPNEEAALDQGEDDSDRSGLRHGAGHR